MPKQKQYECRKCGLVTRQKVEYWQHIPVHYKPEKLLVCNACEFVTVYKHHFEYHQRNHAGYKPFKCDMCEYECVNKSMLNSHLKSHSTIYDYKCGECRYATKYVHSLKVHLQKYNHQADRESPVELLDRRRSPKSSANNSPMSSVSPEHDQNCILDLRIGSKQQQERSQLSNQ